MTAAIFSLFAFSTLIAPKSQAQSMPIPKKPLIDCISDRKDLATGQMEALEIVYQIYTPDVETLYAWHIGDNQYNLKFQALKEERIGVELVTSQRDEKKKNLWAPSDVIKDSITFQTQRDSFKFRKEMPINEKYSLIVECR